MKTAERILITSLEMFNEKGEANISCVDIAIELDISPGNLYYHYKGKEVIVAALFDMYQERINKILNAPQETDLTLEEFFYFLLMLLESIHLFRFLYHNPADLIAKYPLVAKGFKRLLKTKENSFQQQLAKFVADGKMILTPHDQIHMVQLMTLLFTQAANYYLLKGDDIDSEHYLYESLSNVLFALAPYVQMEFEELQQLKAMIESQTLE